jgi:hypothetical protein
MSLIGILAAGSIVTLPPIAPYLAAVARSVQPSWLGPRDRPDVFRLDVVNPFGSYLGASQEVLTALRGIPELESVAAYRVKIVDTSAGRAVAAGVTEGFPSTTRLELLSGRLLESRDYGLKPARVLLVSEAFWRRRLSAAPAPYPPIWIEGKPYSIAGILRASETHRFERIDLWLPMLESSLEPQLPDSEIYLAGRRAPGVTPSRFQSALNLTAKATWGTWNKTPRRRIEAEAPEAALASSLWMRVCLLLVPFVAVLLPTAGLWADQIRRWRGQFQPLRYFGFLAAKSTVMYSILLLLWLSWAAIYPLPFGEAISDLVLETTVALTIVVAGLYGAQWIKQDQKVRCPVCLQRLRMPITEGLLGSVLFARPKDEFICTEGHGVLTVDQPQLLDEGQSQWRKLGGFWEELTRARR